MVVCFSIGQKSKAVISNLVKTADNVEFLTFDSIKDIIKNAQLRHIDFKRIIISSAIVKNPQSEFKELSDFIGEYSNTTEVVLMVGEKAKGTVDVEFNKFFNAPLYTPVVMPRATSRSLLELVLGDIASLAVKYYVPEEIEVTGSMAESGESSSFNPNMQDTNTSVDTSNTNSGFGIGFGPRGIDISNMSSSPADNNRGYEDFSEKYSGGNKVSAPGYSETVMGQDSDFDDDDLSISDYGAQHSDTGFLDESDADELKAYLESQESSKPVVEEDMGTGALRYMDEKSEKVVEEVATEQVVQEKVKKPSSSVYIENINRGVTDRIKRDFVTKSDLNIDLVLSTRSARATQAIIDEAFNLYRKDDAKVLIVDLDFKENRVLSYLRTGEYYRSSSFEGITKQRIYEEDHIGVCSNGYGVPVLTHDIKSLLSSKAVREYELVLIDCPVDCLSVIDEELIEMFHILVFSGGSRQDLVEMTKGLVNRDFVKLSVEKYIMRTCDVEIDEGVKKSDLEYIKKNFLFANGTWLSKITNIRA